MEEPELPESRSSAARRRLTALLAFLVALLLSAPLELALKRRQAVVPDTDDGIKPIAAISGTAREAPRVRIDPAQLPREQPRPEPSVIAELASMIPIPSLLAERQPDPGFSREPVPPPEPERKVSIVRRTSARKKVAKAHRADKVAPPLFARTEDFSDLEFVAQKTPAPKLNAPKPLPPSAVDPVAVPDPIDLADFKLDAPQKIAPARSAVIVERVPSN